MPIPTTFRPRFLGTGLVVAAALSVLSLTVAGCGPPAPAATTGTTVAPSSATQAMPETTVATSSIETASATAGTELFDSSIVHEIAVSFAQADYDAMIATYRSSGEKAWMEATVTIDGVTYQNVGMRLKGNSSIRGLRDDGRGGGPAGGPGGNVSADAARRTAVAHPPGQERRRAESRWDRRPRRSLQHLRRPRSTRQCRSNCSRWPGSHPRTP